MGLFKDDDGTGYLLTEDVSDKSNLRRIANACSSIILSGQMA